MPTQKRSGGVFIIPYQALNCRMSGMSIGSLERGWNLILITGWMIN